MVDTLDQAPDKHAYIVDDDNAFRESLELLLATAGWQVTGFARTADFLERCSNLEPGLLLLDLHMPGESGLELLERKLPELESFAAIVITGAGEIEIAVRSLKAGALDFVEKPFEAANLLTTLDNVHELFRNGMRNRSQSLEARRRIESLSARERDVLAGLVAGGSNKVIARNLDISARTVEMHRARMMAKLGSRSTSEAVRIALMGGMTPTADAA